MFNAIVYTVIRSGYVVRCALEVDDSGEHRLSKICRIIGEAKFAIHDISCTEADGDPPLPRFNMPLELGIYFGAVQYGGKEQAAKSCIIFDRERHRFQRYISDLGGQDIHAHADSIPTMIRELAAWLRALPGGIVVGGGAAIAAEYEDFASNILPALCKLQRLEVDELSFPDYSGIVQTYASTLRHAPSLSDLVAPAMSLSA